MDVRGSVLGSPGREGSPVTHMALGLGFKRPPGAFLWWCVQSVKWAGEWGQEPCAVGPNQKEGKQERCPE